MKKHQFFNVNLAYQLDSIIKDTVKWNGTQFMLQSKYVLGIAQKRPLPIRVVPCHASKLKEMESNDR